jgi:hypothetical protein
VISPKQRFPKPLSMTRQLFFLLFLLLSTHSLTAQINAELQPRDTVDLDLIRVFPDSFPDVALYFKARTRSGRPLWRLPQDKVAVLEEGQSRPVISLRPVSAYTPIQIALAVDHSGSMLDEFIYAFDTIDGQLVIRDIAMRKPGEPFAIDRAKEGVLEFMRSLENEKDSLLVIGFSETVDPVPPMTNDTVRIREVVNEMEAAGATAFYDAVRTGLDSLEHYSGLRAVVALTDGLDNASYTSLDSLIHRAQASEIPVYVIGLGNVDKQVLQRLATETGGEFFYTERARSLSSIYLRISNQMQAIYELIYRSESLASSAERQRELQIVFDIDSVYFGQPLEQLDLPKTAIVAMKDRENRTRMWLAGGMVLLAAAALGFLLLGRREKEEDDPEPIPVRVPETLPTPRAFPNPSAGHVYFSIDLPETQTVADLLITNLAGQPLRQYTVSGPNAMLELDLSQLPAGTYLFRLSTGVALSKAGRLIIAK